MMIQNGDDHNHDHDCNNDNNNNDHDDDDNNNTSNASIMSTFVYCLNSLDLLVWSKALYNPLQDRPM